MISGCARHPFYKKKHDINIKLNKKIGIVMFDNRENKISPSNINSFYQNIVAQMKKLDASLYFITDDNMPEVLKTTSRLLSTDHIDREALIETAREKGYQALIWARIHDMEIISQKAGIYGFRKKMPFIQFRGEFSLFDCETHTKLWYLPLVETYRLDKLLEDDAQEKDELNDISENEQVDLELADEQELDILNDVNEEDQDVLSDITEEDQDVLEIADEQEKDVTKNDQDVLIEVIEEDADGLESADEQKLDVTKNDQDVLIEVIEEDADGLEVADEQEQNVLNDVDEEDQVVLSDAKDKNLLNDRVIEKELARISKIVASQMVEVLENEHWKGFIIEKDDDLYVISAGKMSGVVNHMTFNVIGSMGTIHGIYKQKYLIPGNKIGKIQIIEVDDNESKGMPLYGNQLENSTCITR